MKKTTILAALCLLLSPLFANEDIAIDIQKRELGHTATPIVSFFVKPRSFEKVYFVFSYMNSLFSQKKRDLSIQQESHFQVGFSYRF